MTQKKRSLIVLIGLVSGTLHAEDVVEKDSEVLDLAAFVLESKTESEPKELSPLFTNVDVPNWDRKVDLICYDFPPSKLSRRRSEQYRYDASDPIWPLVVAITGNKMDEVLALIDQGVDINKTVGPEKYTPLLYAAAQGKAHMVRFLLDAGADASYCAPDGHDLSYFANKKGHEEVLRAVKAFEQDLIEE
jgi:hypothetical protein